MPIPRYKATIHRLLYGTVEKSSPFRPLLITVIFLALGGMIWLAMSKGRDFWQAYQNSQAREAVAAAMELHKDGRTSDALRAVSESYQKAPDEPEVIRAFAKLLADTGQENGRYLYDRLHQLGPVEINDRLDETHLNLLLGHLTEATKDAELLMLENPGDPRVENLYARVLDASGNSEAAHYHFEKSLPWVLESAEHRELFAAAEFFFRNPQTRAENLAYLREISEKLLGIAEKIAQKPVQANSRDAMVQRHAMLLLSHGLPLSGADSQRFQKVAETMPQTDYAIKLKALTQSNKWDQESLQKKLGQFKELPPSEQATIAVFLLQNNKSEILLDLYDSATAKRHPLSFFSYIEALVTAGRYDEARAVMAEPDNPLRQGTRDVMRALFAQRHSTRADELENLVQNAIREARLDGNPLCLLLSGKIALDQGEEGLAREAFAPLLREAGTSLRVLSLWENHLRSKNGSASELAEMGEQATNQGADGTFLQITVAYAKLLSGTAMELTEWQLNNLKAKLQQIESIDFLLCLARIRAKDPSAASLLPLNSDPSNLSNPQRVIAYAAYCLAGEKEKADKTRNWLVMGTLLKEETILVERADFWLQSGTGIIPSTKTNVSGNP